MQFTSMKRLLGEHLEIKQTTNFSKDWALFVKALQILIASQEAQEEIPFVNDASSDIGVSNLLRGNGCSCQKITIALSTICLEPQ